MSADPKSRVFKILQKMIAEDLNLIYREVNLDSVAHNKY